MHVCTIVPISKSVGANRIVPAVSIPFPLGNPNVSPDEEKIIRMKILKKALEALTTKVTEQTVFTWD